MSDKIYLNSDFNTDSDFLNEVKETGQYSFDLGLILSVYLQANITSRPSGPNIGHLLFTLFQGRFATDNVLDACTACTPSIVAQFPAVTQISWPDFDEMNRSEIAAWLADQESTLGSTVTLRPATDAEEKLALQAVSNNILERDALSAASTYRPAAPPPPRAFC